VEKQDTGSHSSYTPLDPRPTSRTPWTLPPEIPSRWWMRQSMRTTSNHGHPTLPRTFEPRHPIPYRTTLPHPMPWTAPKTLRTKSEKKSLVSEFLLQTNHVVIQNLLYRVSSTQTSILHPSKAHRICSVKMAGYSWGSKTFEIFLQLF
jgi:hypothetical protein